MPKNKSTWTKVKEAGNSFLSSPLWEKFYDTTLGKIIKIATGNAVSRSISVTLAIIGIVMAASNPVGATIAITAASLALASVVVEIAIDTIDVRRLRRLKKQNDRLVEHANNKALEQSILKIDPQLAKILNDNDLLHKPDTSETKKSETKKYIKENTESQIHAKAVGKTLAREALDWTSSIMSAIGGNPTDVIKAIAPAVLSTATKPSKALTTEKVKIEFKKKIDAERDRLDSPKYNDSKDLKNQVREQRIQTMALKTLIIDPNYAKMSKDDKVAKFLEIKRNIIDKEKAIQGGAFTQATKGIRSFAKDLVRVHDPFSKYNDPEKIKLAEHSKLAKVVEAHQAKKEAIKKTASDHGKALKENINEKSLTAEDRAKFKPNKEIPKYEAKPHARQK